MILGVSLDTAGERAAGTFARSAEPSPLSWGKQDNTKLARATYPLLLDEQHVVAQLYDITNVPMAVWIDEDGKIVRPPEPAGTYDVVKHIDVKTFAVPEEIVKRAADVRATYFDAVRDWVKNGAKSRFALSPAEAAKRAHGPGAEGARRLPGTLFLRGRLSCLILSVLFRARSPRDVFEAARGHACFAIGAWLWRNGEREASKRFFDDAVAAQPDNWAFRRQKIAVADDAAIGNFAATPEFFGAVQKTAAEGKRYYDLIDMPGMPRE